MKYIRILFVLFLCLIVSNAYAQRDPFKMSGKAIEGSTLGSGSIMLINPANLVDGDIFIVDFNDDPIYEFKRFIYKFDTESVEEHNSPWILTPTVSAAYGRWILVDASEWPCDPTTSNCYDILPENTAHPDPPATGIMRYNYDGGYWVRGVEGDPIRIDSFTGDDLGSATASDVANLFTGTGYLKSDGTADTPITLIPCQDDELMVADATEVSGYKCQDLEDHPDFATLLTAFNSAGLNAFTFSPNDTYPRYVLSSPVTISFDITDSSSSYEVAGARWQLDDGGYEGQSLTNTEGDTYTASVALPEDAEYDLQIEATDNKVTPSANTGESPIFPLILDTVDPAIEITEPAADGSWVQSSTYTALAGTSSDDNGIAGIEWKLESDGIYDNTGVTGTTSWSVNSITLAANVLNSIYVRATDSAGRTSEAIRTINVDTINPVVDLTALDPVE